MDAREAARLEEYYRRWLRPDWRRWLHPDWERRVPPAQRAAMREDFAIRDRAFETPLSRRWREEKEQREREEQERLEAEHQAKIEREALSIKAEIAELRYELAMRRKAWGAECAERKLRADIAWERFKAAFMRRDFAPRQKANFNPNQPRVAAGNPDGGQWTSGGGGTQSSPGAASDRITGRNDPRILSDATPDTVKPGTQLAQNDTTRRSPVDLHEEEARGGHTIEKHVNQSPESLIAQARENFELNPRARDSRSGSFSSLEAASKLVNSTLAQNSDIVDRVGSGVQTHGRAFAQFDSVTGVEAVMPTSRSQPYFQRTYGVGVIIDHDPSSPRGYTVWTAFPTNRTR